MGVGTRNDIYLDEFATSTAPLFFLAVSMDQLEQILALPDSTILCIRPALAEELGVSRRTTVALIRVAVNTPVELPKEEVEYMEDKHTDETNY